MTSTAHPKGSPMPQPESADANDKPLIWIDGKMLPKSQATISVYDHGLLYGDGIFEGIRVYRGKIFKSAQHMKRLWRSAKRLRIDIPMTQEEMVAIQRTCINANEIVDGYIRLVVTRGVGNLGLNPFQCPKATVFCIADTISLYPPELYEKGLKVIVAKRPRVPIECLDPRVKSLNYLNNIMAKVESLDLGLLESIMLNIDGYVAECTGDNIFIIKDGNLFTPPGTAGILEGITRNFVIDTLCPQLGLTCTKRNLRLEEVLAADEVFLTGSAAEIIAVTQIGDTVMGDGKEGPITKRLRGRFREIVTSDNVPED